MQKAFLLFIALVKLKLCKFTYILLSRTDEENMNIAKFKGAKEALGFAPQHSTQHTNTTTLYIYGRTQKQLSIVVFFLSECEFNFKRNTFKRHIGREYTTTLF